MSEVQQSPENKQPLKPTSKSRTPVFVVITVLLLAAVIFFFYQNKQLQEESKRQQQEIAMKVLELDSLSGELDVRIQTIRELGGDIDTLEACLLYTSDAADD